ncbi:hypothetical protein QA640_10465 [Bradyrhizobium sp. CB82]|uniref:hypothetical protein n=1 Tax=Bradyrhizobium sp. CB82 TaxID=3039159 RepID=UPI0024B142EB|nr:hypothetical protein [Bradyrhizobium sp. CB82]WFU42835.1 hypothetical protein QA640_10465 [Bradyrhizobium sp. CB82]
MRRSACQGGDKTKAHQENIAKIKKYLATIQSDGRGLPADPSRPRQISYPMVAQESGVKLPSLNRNHSRCRNLIKAAANGGLQISVRLKPRDRPDYTLEEAINIAVACVRDECESNRVVRRQKCKMIDTLLRSIARRCPNGLHEGSITAISAALGRRSYGKKERALLAHISDILLRATRGELQLQTFHGRLKLESALVGLSLTAVSKFTNVRSQTVVHWGAGVKVPTERFVGEIAKIEKALGVRDNYLSEVRRSNRSGRSNVKRHHLPAEVRAMPLEQQKQFRRLIDKKLDVAALGESERQKLMADTLRIYHEDRDTDDFRRAKLRAPDMQYGLDTLPAHVQQEFDDLVEKRTVVMVRDNVPSRLKGWDEDSKHIYYQRFCLFLGWLHYHLGVALENLSIAYLAFDQVLHEYDVFLIDRKECVGMERRWAQSNRDWYIFAASLTRGPIVDKRPKELANSNPKAGWLRPRRDLLSKIQPIDLPRNVDQLACGRGERDDVRPILTMKEIDEASRNWSKRLDDTTDEYHCLIAETEGETTQPDSIGRVLPILRLSKPLMAIEYGALQLRNKIAGLKVGAYHWCTAIRESVMLKIHAQVPLRRQTFCALTYHRERREMVLQEEGCWWLQIPAEVFKNEKSKAFQDLVINGFYTVRLEDQWGLYEDLNTYVTVARDRILSGVESPAFYVTRENDGHVTPGTFAGRFRDLTRDHIAENRGRRTGLPGIKPFGSQAMRHIIASAVFKATGSLAAAAVAIHDSEQITKRHYQKYFLNSKARGKIVEDTMRTEAFEWSKEAVLPYISSPSLAPLSQPLLEELLSDAPSGQLKSQRPRNRPPGTPRARS